MKTVRIHIAECRLPLPRKIKLGAVEITSRDYVAVRIDTDDGRSGFALAYPRNAPLFEAAQRLANRFVDIDPTLRRGVVEECLAAYVNTRPIMARAVSLFEIALTDLAAKASGLPLYRMLGGLRNRVPAMAVAGYYLDERSVEDVRDEVAGLLDAGYPRAKIMLKGNDPAFDARYVSVVSKIASRRLAVDAHWSWGSIAEAMRTCSQIDQSGLAFIEDPFGAHNNHMVEQLQPLLATPIACGEDVTDSGALLRLAGSARVLRVDATVVGGIAPASIAIEAASVLGVPVVPHVFTALHGQLAGAYPGVEMVEIIPAECGADPIDRLQVRPPRIVDGHLLIDEEPGVGLDLNWDEVGRHAVRGVTVETDA